MLPSSILPTSKEEEAEGHSRKSQIDRKQRVVGDELVHRQEKDEQEITVKSLDNRRLPVSNLLGLPNVRRLSTKPLTADTV